MTRSAVRFRLAPPYKLRQQTAVRGAANWHASFSFCAGFCNYPIMPLSEITFLIFTNLAAILVLLTILWFVSIRVKDASIIDIAWGPACAAPAVCTYFRTEGADPRALILMLLSVLWAARLGLLSCPAKSRPWRGLSICENAGAPKI